MTRVWPEGPPFSPIRQVVTLNHHLSIQFTTTLVYLMKELLTSSAEGGNIRKPQARAIGVETPQKLGRESLVTAKS